MNNNVVHLISFICCCCCWADSVSLDLQEHVEGYLQDIFDFERVRYVTVEDMAEDVWALARQRIDTVNRQMPRR